MLAGIWSAAIVRIDAVKVGVEVDVSGGLSKTVVVGLPDAAIQESKERVKAAIKNAGFAFPVRKIVVNLLLLIYGKNSLVSILPLRSQFEQHRNRSMPIF